MSSHAVIGAANVVERSRVFFSRLRTRWASVRGVCGPWLTSSPAAGTARTGRSAGSSLRPAAGRSFRRCGPTMRRDRRERLLGLARSCGYPLYDSLQVLGEGEGRRFLARYRQVHLGVEDSHRLLEAHPTPVRRGRYHVADLEVSPVPGWEHRGQRRLHGDRRPALEVELLVRDRLQQDFIGDVVLRFQYLPQPDPGTD